MASRNSASTPGGGLLSAAACIVGSLVLLASVSSLSFTSLVGSMLSGLAAGFGVLAPAPVAIGVVAIVVWRSRRRLLRRTR